MDRDWIHKSQERIIACYVFFDTSELRDIEPNFGNIFIHLTSDPHNEKMVIDEQRLNYWIVFLN